MCTQWLKASAVTSMLLALLIWNSTAQAAETSETLLTKKPGSGTTANIIAKRLASDWKRAPIQSYSDLYDHIRALPDNGSPFNRMSEATLAAFLDSLVITEKGLGSFSPAPLQAELTPNEIYEVLSLFGAQRLTYALGNMGTESTLGRNLASEKTDVGANSCLIDHHKCELPATCVSFFGAICIWCNCTTK